MGKTTLAGNTARPLGGKEGKGMVNKIEKQSRQEYLDQLIEDFKREQTIQDVGLFLVNFPAYRLPNRLADVLSQWLKKTSDRKLAYSKKGRPKTELTDYFPLIDGMRVTGMSVYAACHLIIDKLELYDVNPDTLQKRYGEHRTPDSRFVDDLVFGPARIRKSTGVDFSQLEKAAQRLGVDHIDASLNRQLERLVDRFGLVEVQRAAADYRARKKP